MFRCLLLIWGSLALAQESLKFVAIIYRHGDRTPVDTYPTDPYRNESIWPAKFGQLTNTGKKQHYAFGEWLRERYAGLLSKQYDPTQIRIQSTDVDRTLMSAAANLAGMFPPNGSAVWNNKLKWQPIPIHTKPEKDDEVLAMKKKCPAYEKEIATIKNSAWYQDQLKQFQPLMNYLMANTGKQVKDYEDILDIYSILNIETIYNFSLPNWTHTVFPDEMRKPACHSFNTFVLSPTTSRLRAGPLLKDIVTHIDRAARPGRRASPLKMVVYSGHDLTIGTMLTALKLFDGNCPVYTSAIFFELFEDLASKKLFIRVSYRNTTEIAEPTVLSIPYCGEKCPLERFKKLYENLITVNFDDDCAAEPIPKFMLQNLTNFLTVMLFMTIAGYMFRVKCYNRHQITRSRPSRYIPNIHLNSNFEKVDSVSRILSGHNVYPQDAKVLASKRGIDFIEALGLEGNI